MARFLNRLVSNSFGIVICHKAGTEGIDKLVDTVRKYAEERRRGVSLRMYDYTRNSTGENWPIRLLAEFRKADGVVFLLTQEYLEGQWALTEAFAAKLVGAEVLPFRVPPLKESYLDGPISGILGTLHHPDLDLGKVDSSSNTILKAVESAASRHRKSRWWMRVVAAMLLGILAMGVLAAGSAYFALKKARSGRDRVLSTTREMESILTQIQRICPGRFGETNLSSRASRLDHEVAEYRGQRNRFQQLQESFAFDYIRAIEELELGQADKNFAGTANKLLDRAKECELAWEKCWERAEKIRPRLRRNRDLIPFLRAGQGQPNERLEFVYCSGPLLAKVTDSFLESGEVKYVPGESLIFILLDNTESKSSFYMSKFELTVGQWRDLGGTPPHLSAQGLSRNPDPHVPIVFINFRDVVKCLSRTNLRIPTEAEWNYAARRYSERHLERDLMRNRKWVWLGIAPDARPQPVGWQNSDYDTLAIHRDGIHDLVGNVWEWCLWKREDFSLAKMKDREDSEATMEMPVRGGSYYRDLEDPFSTKHQNFDVHAFQDVGVRVVLDN